MFTDNSIDNKRVGLWINHAATFAELSPWMGVSISNLGLLDGRISFYEKKFLAEMCSGNIPNIQINAKQHMMFTNDLITQSHLWVLGIYEIVRTISQFSREKSSNIHSYEEEIRNVKNDIARLRIPLAKFEPASKHPNDFPIAYPGFNDQHGIGWFINDKRDFITRKAISDNVLDLFNNIKSKLAV